MLLRYFKIVSLVFIVVVLASYRCVAQDIHKDSHIEVSLRMIGHQVLLSAGDSISRVLPILKENNRYRIQFESEFEFVPEQLVWTIDEVVKKAKLTNNYIVEVEKCETKETVYSFKIDVLEKLDIVPCKTRMQPKSCYSLVFIFIEKKAINTVSPADTSDTSNRSSLKVTKGYYNVICIMIVLIAIGLFFLRKRRTKLVINSSMIPLGKYYFDKRNAELLIGNQRIELTHKEADLLFLLYTAVNKTVEREVFLNRVWGDEGDYIGRTLDVYISKLRKKLELDSKVKIVNVRGVGYKLVMDM